MRFGKTSQLPAIVQPTALSTSMTDAHPVPALIAGLGEQASWRCPPAHHAAAGSRNR
jgi:hypothetical protein